MPRSVLESHPVLGELDPATRDAVTHHLTMPAWSPGQQQQLSSGLWLLARGEAQLLPPSEPQPLCAGALLGISSLWSKSARMPVVGASTSCTWVQLSQARFVTLRQEDPRAALQLLMTLLRHLSSLTPNQDSNGELGHQQMLAWLVPTESEAPLAPPEKVTIVLHGEKRLVPVGTAYHELLPEQHEHLTVVAALVDSKATSLNGTVTSSCRLEALTTRQWEGQRIYRHSLSLLALEAAHNVAPDLTVRMGPSVGFGRRILPAELVSFELHDFATQLENEMQRLRSMPLVAREAHWTVDQARDYFTRHGWADTKKLLDTWREPMVPVVSYGSVYVLNITPVVTTTRSFDNFFVLCDDNLVLLVYGKRSEHTLRPTRTMPPSALSPVGQPERPNSELATGSLLLGQAHANHAVERQERAWLQAMNVTSIGAFNHACISGSVPSLIRVAEGFQEKRLTTLADEIQRRADAIDIVCIAGPSASGKSTFIRKLCVQLQVNGINPVALGLDDYYIDRERTQRDATGDYDFECLEALQRDLLQDHLERLLSGERVRTARYAFAEGKSYPTGGREIRLHPRDVLMLEGIHGLNPALLGEIPPHRVFRIFVCPLMQLAFDQLSRVHASDVRLIRRIVRDRHSRGYGAAQTIERWPKVRAGERQHIYPYQAHSDAVFDSSLVYELSVLRVYAERYLLEIPDSHPSYQTAYRLMHLLDRFVSIYPDHVPATSILREFIGGSGFEP